MLLARLDQATPLICPICQADMRILAFVTDGDSLHHILEYIGASADPPRIWPPRGPPAWEAEVDSLPPYDPIAQPKADFQLNQMRGG